MLAELPLCLCGRGHSYIAAYEGLFELFETMLALSQGYRVFALHQGVCA